MPLAQHFLDQYTREMRKTVEGFTPEARAYLEAHPFPGNVRELRNMVERAVILCQGRQVTSDNLHFEPGFLSDASQSIEEEIQAQPAGLSNQDTGLAEILSAVGGDSLNLAAFEKALLQEALLRSGGKQIQAAEFLGISRTSIRTRMTRHGLL